MTNTSFFNHERLSRFFLLSVILCVVFGLVFRAWNIAQNDFVFYDEGLYLNHNRVLGQIFTVYFPKSLSEFGKALYAYISSCLASGKSLWFAIADSRIFFGLFRTWFYARIMASVFGCATLLIVYRFARRWYASKAVAGLSLAILALLPSHVFYSRIGMQEALSTFLVSLGLYLYVFSRQYNWRSFVSGAIFAACFFSNYRLIILPVPIIMVELWLAWFGSKRVDERRLVTALLMFTAGVFVIGNIDNGRNTFLTFAWMFHQAQMAGEVFHPVNFLSYPYYLFRLEHWLFGLMFFLSFYGFKKGTFSKMLPMVFVLLMMAIFSLPSEKGARYLCITYPFMAMSVAFGIVSFYERFSRWQAKAAVAGLCVAMIAGLAVKSYAVALIRSDYRTSAEYILSQDPQAKWFSTQDIVQSLYASRLEQVKPCPNSFEGLAQGLAEGYRFLVIDPQAYVSWIPGKERFPFELIGYLEYLKRTVRPVKEFSHFSDVMLERFVFEHSGNLLQSVHFLNAAKKDGFSQGRLYVYDVNTVVNSMLAALLRSQSSAGGTP
ncbi:MAG TPA: hypothetical protein P5160_02385 [Candidatus Omnitrophota bacterium]|nr:hypothetical protein [Candidatus Omnitrophota bacterium]